MDAKEKIARRVALELENGQLVNLGIGLPTLVTNYLSPDIEVILQSENGMVGMKAYDESCHDDNITNAGGNPVSIQTNGAFFDSSMSFALIRGGHVDVTILGSLEVDQEGNIANYMIPNKLVPGMGGAMDLVTGAKKVIVSMLHTSKGVSKILKKCQLPLTGKNCVNMIITELAVFEIIDRKMYLREVSKDSSIEEVTNLTDADFNVDSEIKYF